MLNKLTALSAAVLSAALIVSGCGKDPSQKAKAAENAGAEARRVNVETLELYEKPFSEMISLNGVLEAYRMQKIASERAGAIEWLGYDEGKRVGAGAIMARIDSRMIEAQYEQAKASLQLAEATLERVKSLFEKQLATAQDMDSATAARDQAASAARIAEIAVSQSTVKAPFTGHVVKKYVEQGEIVGAGLALYEFAEVERLKLVVPLPESDVHFVKEGATVEVEVGALGGQKFEGVISRVSLTGDSKTRTFPTEITIANKNLELKPGMAARVKITRKSYESALAVPFDALQESLEGKIAYVVEDEKARARKVSVSFSEGGEVVVKEGLKKGDELIVVGNRMVVEGQPVKVVKRNGQPL